MTYKQAYDKIIQAYFKDEIKPYDAKFCFCGTLAGNNYGWHKDSYKAFNHNMPHHNFMNYTGAEYTRMENALLKGIDRRAGSLIGKQHKDYEDALFEGMCAALDVLKEIHRSRGEDVDETLTLTKRQLN